LTNFENADFGDKNRLLSIVNIDQNDEKTPTGQDSTQDPFSGDAITGN
jgi:hypothetical protein